jgi:putative restriction endonuclease
MPRRSKAELLEIIKKAIIDDGWNLFYLANPRIHPFRIKVFTETESINLRIYIWNLTHGGGQHRPADEYRIQITGITRFEAEPGGKTLILGWWEEAEVFAAFDFTRHSGHLGYSPSIQIREEALRRAVINGFAPWQKESGEIAIAFRPDFFMEYVKNLESLHSFDQNARDFQVLEEAAENPDQINDTVLNTVSQRRKTTVANITQKVRDNSFKSRVLTAYSNRCAFCSLQLKLIDASHILPVSFPDSTDETSNGLALCALHHRAFDKSMVTLNENYQIIHNDFQLRQLRTEGLDGGMDKFIRNLRAIIHVPPAVGDRPHTEYIRKANEFRGWNFA